MNEKLSLQDLVDLLSKQAKITKKDADSFYRELFQLVLERIFDNDLVKIKDFGTFKLISVSSRESVNVNTGDKIEIPSHYKLSFIPDKVLKGLVNKPFSQFETIMLEDGVIFEASVDNEVNVSEDEFIEKTQSGIKDNDENIVPETEKPIEVDAVSVNENIQLEVKKENTQDTDTPKVSKPQNTTNQTYPRSFVYNYTTSTSAESTGSITLTVPKSDLVGADLLSKEEDEIPPLDILPQNEFSIELKDLPVITDDTPDADLDEKVTTIEEESGELPPSIEEPEWVEDQVLDEEDHVEEIKNLSEEAEADILAAPLSKVEITDDLELESDFHSEIETEEDIIIPVPVVEKNEKPKPAVVEKKQEKESRTVFSNEDPERPLFPIEEDQIIDDLNFTAIDGGGDSKKEVNDKKINEVESANMHSYAGNNKPTETKNVLFSDTIDPIDIPYVDYNNQGAGSRLRKWLPMILFLLVIVGFLTYGLVKMLSKPYDYEYNLGRTNLSSSDTFPQEGEASPQVKETDALLDSMKRVQGVLAEDTVKAAKQEPIVPIAQVPVVKQKVESVQAAIVGDADSITTQLIDAEKNSFVISERLKFGILNKAEYHLLKYGDSKNHKLESVPVTTPSTKSDTKETLASKPRYETIKRGTTLRTISTAHYGKPDYWVYIYQANKKNIANPNNVPIGTTLVIPFLSDYGVSDPKSSTAIQAAKKLESQILRQR